MLLGWLKPKLDAVDRIRLEYWNEWYNMDASYRTIPHKFGPQQSNQIKNRLDASCQHLHCKYGYQINDTLLLAKGAESYEKTIVQHVGHTISDNMKLCKYIDTSKYDFTKEINIGLNLDIGSECNVDNVRNCIVHGIRQGLGYDIVDDDRHSFNNVHNIDFDLRKISVQVLYLNIFTI